MNNFMLKVGDTVATLALKVTALNVNTACCFFSHQEKLPKGAEKLRKF